MSDDLVKRLRDDSGDWLTDLAADRIEELEDKLDWVLVERDETFALMLDRAQTAEAKLATCEKYKAEFIRMDRIAGLLADSNDDLEAKLSESEALLAKAVEALEFYATQDVTYPNVGTVTFHGHDDNGCKARATLAELTGGKDE